MNSSFIASRPDQTEYCKFRNFHEVFFLFSQSQSFAKIKPLQNGEITLPYTDVGTFVNCAPVAIFLRHKYRRVAEIQIFEKTYLIVIKDETGLKFKINDYFISDWVVRSKVGSIILKNGEITQCLQKTET